MQELEVAIVEDFCELELTSALDESCVVDNLLLEDKTDEELESGVEVAWREDMLDIFKVDELAVVETADDELNMRELEDDEDENVDEIVVHGGRATSLL